MAKKKLKKPIKSKDVPATRAMLVSVRDQLIKRMDSKFHGIDGKLQGVNGKFYGLNVKFKSIDEQFAKVDHRFARIDEQFAKVDERFAKLESKIDGIAADVHEMKFMMENQHAENKFMLDHLNLIYLRQDRVENRVDEVEKSIANFKR